jgi:hypothetical protein
VLRADAVCETFVVLRQDNESLARSVARGALPTCGGTLWCGPRACADAVCEAFRAREIVGDIPGFA